MLPRVKLTEGDRKCFEVARRNVGRVRCRLYKKLNEILRDKSEFDADQVVSIIELEKFGQRLKDVEYEIERFYSIAQNQIVDRAGGLKPWCKAEQKKKAKKKRKKR